MVQIGRKSTAMLKTVTPTPGTPTASFRGKRGKVNGVSVWLKGESPSGGDSYSRSPYQERAAYIVNEMLDLKLVPSTILHLVDGEVVSAMRWVRGTCPFGIVKPPLLNMFDYLIRNSDRHSGNWLVKPSGRVWAIDNALSFHMYADDFYGDDELPNKVRVKLKKVVRDTRTLRRRLEPLLENEQINALIERMRNVLKNGKWETQLKKVRQ